MVLVSEVDQVETPSTLALRFSPFSFFVVFFKNKDGKDITCALVKASYSKSLKELAEINQTVDLKKVWRVLRYFSRLDKSVGDPLHCSARRSNQPKLRQRRD